MQKSTSLQGFFSLFKNMAQRKNISGHRRTNDAFHWFLKGKWKSWTFLQMFPLSDSKERKSSAHLFFFFKFLYKTYFWKDFSFNFVFLKHVFSFSSHYIDFCNEFAGKALLFLHFQPVYILYQSFLVPKCYLDFCGSPLIAFLKSDRENCTLEALFFLFYTLLRCMTCPSALNNLIKSWGKNIARHNAATAGFFSYFL